MLAAWVGAQAGFATVSGLGRCPVLLGLGIGLVLVLAVDVELKYIISTMISVGHRSLSGIEQSD